MTKVLMTLLMVTFTLPAFASTAAPAPDPTADQAVAEYLKLRHQGKPHHAAFQTVQKQFKVTEEAFESAANRIATQGYSRNDDREPSSKK